MTGTLSQVLPRTENEVGGGLSQIGNRPAATKCESQGVNMTCDNELYYALVLALVLVSSLVLVLVHVLVLALVLVSSLMRRLVLSLVLVSSPHEH